MGTTRLSRFGLLLRATSRVSSISARTSLSLICRRVHRFQLFSAVAEQFVKSGQYNTVAVVGSDKLSTITDYEDRNTCVLFGDGQEP